MPCLRRRGCFSRKCGKYAEVTAEEKVSQPEAEDTPAPQEGAQEGENAGSVANSESDGTIDTLQELQAALNDAASVDAENTTVELAGDITVGEGEQWSSVYVDGYNGAGVVTLNGNGHTISGLNAPLFKGGFGGQSGIVINALTLKDVDLNDTSSEYSATGFGAFICAVDSMPTISLTDCHVKGGQINSTSGVRVGALIGWTSGYNEKNDGPVDTYVTLKDCSVEDVTLEAKGSVGGLIGHAGANPTTYSTITNCKVTNCGLISSKDDWCVGDLIGTANSGKVTIDQVTVDQTAGNTRNQRSKTDSAIENGLVGRAVLNETGLLIVAGKVTAADTTVALVKTTQGAMTPYPTLAKAVEAAKDNDTVMLVKDVELNAPVAINKSITIDGNHKQITGVTGNNQVNLFHVGQNISASIKVTIENCKFKIESNEAWNVGIYVQNQVEELTIQNNIFNINTVKADGSFQCIGLDYNENRVTKNVTITGNTVHDNHTGTGGTQFVVAGQANGKAYLNNYSTQTLTITDNRLFGRADNKRLTGVLVSHVDGLTVTGNRFNDCYIGLCLNSNNTNDTSKPFQQATVIKEIIHGNDDAGTSSYVLVLSGKAPMATDTKTITLWDVAYKRVGLATDKATGNAEDTLSKIGFYANGGTFGADSNNPDRQITDVTYVAFDGTEITLPTAPTRDGYTFTGWATAPPEGQTPVKLGNDATTYKADHSLQFLAQWEKVTTFTVTYTDGVDGEEIFPDQSYTVESGKTTPAFNGTPTRKDYTFTGWKPAVAATVTGNATYEAIWKSNSATTTSSGNTSSGNTSSAGKTSSTGKTTSPKTGDASNVLPWFALLFISGGAAIGTTVISRKKKYNK